MKKQVTETQYLCDICGKRADGNFFMDMNVNDDCEDTYYCPLDLCKDCMRNFNIFIGDNEVKMMQFLDSRRSGLRCSEANKKVLIRELGRMNENDNEWHLWGANY